MFLQRKIDRAVKWSRERKLREQGIDPEQLELEEAAKSGGKGSWKQKSPLPSMEEILREERELGIEKQDLFALIFSGLITILPVVLLILLAIFAIVFLLFLR